MNGPPMLFWWVLLPLAVMAGAGLMAVIERCLEHAGAARTYRRGYDSGWDARLAAEQAPPPFAGRRPGGHSRTGAAAPRAPQSAAQVWENMPAPPRPRRDRRDTMDLVSNAYMAGKDGRPHLAPAGYVDRPPSEREPWRMTDPVPPPVFPGPGAPPGEQEPRSVLRELGIEPGREYPGTGWVSGPCIDDGQQPPAGGGV